MCLIQTRGFRNTTEAETTVRPCPTGSSPRVTGCNSRQHVKKEVKRGNPPILDDDEICPGVSGRITGATRYPLEPPAIAQFFSLGNCQIVKVEVSRPDRARDAIDLFATTVRPAGRIVEHAIVGEDFIDGGPATRGVVFTEHFLKIVDQQGRYAGNGLSPLGIECGLEKPGRVTFDPSLTHDQWVDGMMVQTGMTTTFPPNTTANFMNGSTPVDVDFMSTRLGTSATNLSYGTMTARSYHSGTAQILMMDGSVRTASNNIDRGIWRALGTRANREMIGEF